MAKCMACGKTALLTTTFGKVVLCKNCGSLLNVPVWSNRVFDSMDELVSNKNDAIQRAVTSNMPQEIINEISKYFDEYIDAGYVTAINGKAGQTLKVFKDFCIINTKNETKKIELENMFYQFDDDEDDDDDDELISSDDKRNLVRGLMSGKLVQTGVGVAVSAALNQQEKEKASERKSRERHRRVERLITVGDRRVMLSNLAGVESFSRANTANGYLRFIPKGTSSKDLLYGCEYFFFNNSIPFETKKIKQKVETVKDIILMNIANAESEAKAATARAKKEKDEKAAAAQAEQVRKMVEEVAQQNKTDAFDEIRKFKMLLDEGIITEEEFNMKKKQLLGL